MTERDPISRQARTFFEDLWKQGDPWQFETSEFERLRCARLFEMLTGRRYSRVLELGCGAGMFTRLLGRISDRVVALDVSATAIERAKAAQTEHTSIEFRIANIMEFDLRAEGPWDLVVMSDTIYYLGWLYSFFEVGWLAMEIFAATQPGGKLLMPNSYGGTEDYLMRPSLIRTYRDLFVNVGYRINTEEIFCGTKNGIRIEILMTLFEKAAR